jgi:glycerol dehydrogenase-like iron-containing ADH family enzyme
MTDIATTEEGDALEVLAALPGAVIVTNPTAWALVEERVGGRQPHFVSSLEEIALERLHAAVSGRVGDGGRGDGGGPTAVLGIGGGLAMDAAKDLALRTGGEVVLLPTMLSTLAPFTNDIARRARRQVHWAGEVSARVVLDLGLIAKAPAERNRAGAAEVVATMPAVWDWRLADDRGIGLPLSARLVELVERCRTELGAVADAVAEASTDGLRTLAELLAALGAGCARAGLRRPIDGSAHTFVQAYEHRLGPHPTYGGMLGLGTVAMATLQAWFGLSAGGPIDPDAAIDLLTRCRVAANPAQLGLDEGTFRGILRHTVRFAVGESLPYSVLNEADVNWSASEEMWRLCWRVPRVA